MADYDPEQAFILSMQNDATYSPNNYQDAPMEEDEESDYDPSSLSMGWQAQNATGKTSQLEGIQQDSIESPSIKSPALSAAPSVSVAGSQIPSRTSSTVPATTTAPPVKSPPSSVTKPRTIGGFAADDSDDEDAVPPFQSKGAGSNGQSALGGSAQSQSIASPLRSVTQTPNISSNNASSSQNVLIKDATAADASARQETSAVADQNSVSLSNAVSGAPSSVTPQPQSSSLLVPAPATPTAAVSTEQPGSSGHAASSALPRQRLPTDVIGILEDRIVEDSRGDLDAWLSLIGEYKKRNRFDDARAVWERFFTVFPTAVSFSILVM